MKYDKEESLEYLDECFIAYTEAMVIRFNENIGFPLKNHETCPYFFEHQQFPDSSSKYTKESRERLRTKIMMQSRHLQSIIGENSNIDPIVDFLNILLKNDYGLPDEVNTNQLVNIL